MSLPHLVNLNLTGWQCKMLRKIVINMSCNYNEGGSLGKHTRAVDKPKWDAINSLSELKKYSNKA